MTSVTCIIQRRFQLTRADISAVHTSLPITLATTTSSHVPTTAMAVSVIATGHAAVPAKPAAFSAVITKPVPDGKWTVTLDCADHIFLYVINDCIASLCLDTVLRGSFYKSTLIHHN